MITSNEYTLKLSNIMEEKEISQRKLSILSGVSRPYISQILSGKHIPRLDIVCKICEGLQCSLNELVEINKKEC